MSKTRASKFDDRIYFCTKNNEFIHCKWDCRINGVTHWWWSNYHNKHGYIKGKLKIPKSWKMLGRLQEGTMSELTRWK